MTPGDPAPLAQRAGSALCAEIERILTAHPEAAALMRAAAALDNMRDIPTAAALVLDEHFWELVESPNAPRSATAEDAR